MKKGIFLLLLFLGQITMAQRVIKKADKLIAAEQYASAYALLEDKDPQNRDPQIVVKKADMAMDYFVTSIMHQTFAFKDLEEGETLMELRQNIEGTTYAVHLFPVHEVLDSLIERHPEDYGLHRVQGKFYYEVYLKYGDNWLMGSEELLEKMYYHSKLATDNGKGDFLSYYLIGFYETLQQKYVEAIPAYQQSVALNPEFPTSQYNLAICHLYTDSSALGIPHAEKALELYASPDLKADAARLVGVLYKDIQQLDKANEFLSLSDEIKANDYYTLRQLLDVELAMGQTKEAQLTADRFFEINPAGPAIVDELFGIFASHYQDTLLFPVLNQNLEEYKDNWEVLGNIYYHLGRYFLGSGDSDSGKRFLALARRNFKKVLEPDHPVFGLIEEMLNDEIKE